MRIYSDSNESWVRVRVGVVNSVTQEIAILVYIFCVHTLLVGSPNLRQPNDLTYLLRNNPLLRSFILDSNFPELGFNSILLRAAIFESLINLINEHRAITCGAMHHGDELRKKQIWDGSLWY